MLKDKALHPLLALLEEPGATVVPQGELFDHQILCCAHLLPQIQVGLWGGWESTATAEDAAVLRTPKPAQTVYPLLGVPVLWLGHLPMPGTGISSV